jgi:conjugative transfer region lipoprotein (TIGR03751 family)
MAMPTATAHSAPRLVNNSTERARALVAALCTVSVALTGCASGSKLSTIPSDGPTMEQIYRQHMAGTRDRAAEGGPRATTAAFFERHASTRPDDIDSRFARLPNPDLVMYVTPHLSPNGRYPIPGYSTVFPMYETVEYAMPGEGPWRRSSVALPPRGPHSPPPASSPAASMPAAAGSSAAPPRKPNYRVAGG